MTYRKSSRKHYNRQTLLPVAKPQVQPKTITPSQFVRGVQRAQKAISKAMTGTLEKDAQGYFARFPSKSDPSQPPYTTRIWTVRSGRFRPGDVSCNCKGFIYNHKCHHCTDIAEMWRNDPHAQHFPLNI